MSLRGDFFSGCVLPVIASTLPPPSLIAGFKPLPMPVALLALPTAQGDYHRYLAEFKTGTERKEAAEHTLLAYKAAQVRTRGSRRACRIGKRAAVHKGGTTLRAVVKHMCAAAWRERLEGRGRTLFIPSAAGLHLLSMC